MSAHLGRRARRYLTPKRIALATLLLAVVWFVYGPAYCFLVFVLRGWSAADQQHVKTLPAGCGVITLPADWGWYEDRVFALHEVDVQFRLSPTDPGQALIAFLAHNSSGSLAQKYGFRLPPPTGGEGTTIEGLRRITDSEWEGGARMPFAGMQTGTASSFDTYKDSGAPIEYAGRSFRKTDTYYLDWGHPALLSAGERRLAVFSYGRPRMNPGGMPYPWSVSLAGLLRPWRTYSIDIYDVAGGARLRHVRTWCCYDGLFFDAAWQGDTIFSAHLDPDAILLCGFRDSPR